MKRKWLSIILALSLLVSLVCVGSFNSMADTTGYTVTTLTSGDSSEETVATLNATLGKINVAKNATYALRNSSYEAASITAYGSNYYMFDGCLPGINDATEYTVNTKFCYVIGSTKAYLVMDFGGTASVEEILLASSSTTTAFTDALGTVNVYLGNDVDTLISSPAWSGSFAVSAASIIKLDAAVTATCAAVQLNSGAAIYSEVGFYSSQPVKVIRDAYTFDKVSYSASGNSTTNKKPMYLYNGITSYKSFAEEVMSGNNLLATAATPVYYNNSTDFSAAGTSLPNYAYVTDGNIDGVTNAAVSNKTSGWSYADSSVTTPTAYVYYDLNGVYNVQSLLIMGAATEYGSWGNAMGNIAVYLSETKDGLVSDDNLVASETGVAIGGLLTLNEAKSARYMAIAVSGSSGSWARFSELGVYEKDKGYTEIAISAGDATSVATVNATLGKINVAKNATYSYRNSSYEATSPTYYSDLSFAFDGRLPGINDDTAYTGSTQCCHVIANSKIYVVMEFDGTASVDEILLAGPKTSSAFTDKLGTVNVYMGNDVDTLLTAATWSGSFAVDAATVIQLDKPVTATCAAVQVQSGASLYAEIGFYSDTPVKVEKDTYTVEKISYSASGCLSSGAEKISRTYWYNHITSYKSFAEGVMSADNLLVGASSLTYYNNSTDFSGNGRHPSDATYATDGSIDGITNINTSNQIAGWSYSEGYASLFYDLRDTYDIQSLFVTGAATEYGSYGHALGDICVYMGDSRENLVSDGNLVFAETGLKVGALMTLKTARSARYVAIQVSNASGHYARFSEIGVYGTRQENNEEREIRTLGSGIRTKSNALPSGSGSVALRFATTLNCAGVTVDGYVGDYSAATVTVDGTTYPISGVGTLVARESVITRANLSPEEAMVCGGAVVTDVPAKNIYSQADDKQSITYTAVVTNVPYNLYGEDICARSYVRYTTPEGEAVMYSDVMVRNVYDVWATVAPTDHVALARADYLNDGSGYFEQGARIVFVGDSITNDGTYVSEIFKYYAAKYPADKVEMYMVGARGDTAAEELTYLEDRLLSYNPDYVSIMYGMNDIQREGYTSGYEAASDKQKSYIDAYEENMEKLIQALQAKGVKVILCTPTPYDETCTSGSSSNYPGCFEALQVCAEKARELATKYDCILADFNTPMSEAALYVQNPDNGGDDSYTIIASDRIHPGVLGHDMMARIWLKAVGEDVSVPTNEQMLDCVTGEATVNNLFQDLGTEFSDKVAAVSDAGIKGTVNKNICAYWEGEIFFVEPENYAYMTVEEKINYVANTNRYEGDWRGYSVKEYFTTNASNVGANRYAVQQLIKGVYN